VNILFVVPYAPSRVRTRPYHLIRALRALGHEITLATIGSRGDDLNELRELVGSGRVVIETLPLVRSLWNCLSAVRAGRPLQADFSWSPALAGRVREILDEHCPDVVHVEHLRGSCYGVEIRRQVLSENLGIPVVWDSVDCISHLFEQARHLSSTRRSRLIAGLEAGRTRRHEARLLRHFSSTVVTSELDKRALLDLAGAEASAEQSGTGDDPRVTVVGNGVDLDYFHPAESERHPRTVVFTGKMSYHANVTAVQDFARDVLPLVRGRFPDVQFVVVGKDPPAEIRRLADRPHSETESAGNREAQGGIAVTGTVEDIRPFLWKATAAVAPIKYGAGIQNKVLEAMSCGTPVVASRQAIAALTARVGTDCLVADNPVEYAAALGSLFEHPARGKDVGSAGRRYVERCHDWLASARRLEAVYIDARQRTGTVRLFRSAS
jgi:glycosyltransferase involved in cell wall biosynthesis